MSDGYNIPPAPDKDDKHACVIIEPPKELQEKAVVKKDNGFNLDASTIKKAEEALEDLSDNFDKWLHEEVEKLVQRRVDALSNSLSPESVEALCLVSHDLKGQAATYGYPIIAQFCDSLCYLLETFPDKPSIPIILINQHVDAVRAIIHEDVKTEEDAKAANLLTKLRDVTREYVESELKKIAKENPDSDKA